MVKNEKIDATFNIEEEDLGNQVVSLMEDVTMNSFLAGIQIGIMDAFEKINIAVAEGYKESDKVIAAGSLGKHLS